MLELWSLVENAEPSKRRRYLREILEINPRNARAAGELGERLAPEAAEATAGIDEFDSAPHSVGRDPEGTGSEMLDVEDLEELSDDEFDVAEPSAVRDPDRLDRGSPRAAEATFGRRRRHSEVPLAEDDELIPVVVEPSRVREFDEAPEDAAPVVEDRFGFDDEPASSLSPSASDDRFGFDDEAAPAMAPTDSEAHAIDEGAEAIARESARHPLVPAEDEHDVHTRFDGAPKFDHAALFGGNEEIDEADLPPMAGLPGVKGTATMKAPQPLLDDDDDERERERAMASPANKPITRTVQTPAALLQPEESGPSAGRRRLARGRSRRGRLLHAAVAVRGGARASSSTLLARHPEPSAGDGQAARPRGDGAGGGR